ncbi:MAG TPA: GAF domain-containing protein, partial [Anaerolineales bacterium]|nr:GAF domain-containing protein [Anaerolineales bacterium]
MLRADQKPALERYQHLLSLTQDLASRLNLDVLLNRIIQVAADLSDAEAASILLYDEIHKELYFHSATNLDNPLLRGLAVPVEGSIAGWIFSRREPVIVSSARDDPRFYGHIEKSTSIKTDSILGVPLITRERIIGVLEVINKREGEFSTDDQEILMALGAQAAVAIENARLFQQFDLVSEFVHELRTPLASITTAAHLLMRPETSEEQRRQLASVVQSETMRLSEMATSFLDFARLESGRSQFNISTFDLGELLTECAGVIQLRTNELRLMLVLDISQKLPALEADRDKVKQVVLNLLSNAHKYNRPNGSIHLSARRIEDRLAIEVKDTGRGIPEDEIPRLFEKFFRSPGTENFSSGTGL